MQRTITLLLGSVLPLLAIPAYPDDWPQWRGGDGNAMVTGLDLGELSQGFRVAPQWSQPIGSGFSGISTWEGHLFTAETQGGEEYLLALEADDGAVLWRSPMGPAVFADGPGAGPRATPLVTEDAVYVVGSQGSIGAYDRRNGALRWSYSLTQQTQWRPAYGYAASPVLHHERLIYPAGGRDGNALIALDRSTGKVQWSAGDGPISYATPVIRTVADVEQLIALTDHQVLGIAPSSGQMLWSYPWPGKRVDSSATPLVTGEQEILLSAIDTGSILLRLSRSAKGLEAAGTWESDSLDSDYATGLILGDSVYGVDGSFLLNMDLESGDLRWKARGYHLASLVGIDHRFVLALNYACELKLVKADASAYRELGSETLFPFQRCLTSPTVVNDRIYVRNEKQIAAFGWD